AFAVIRGGCCGDLNTPGAGDGHGPAVHVIETPAAIAAVSDDDAAVRGIARVLTDAGAGVGGGDVEVARDAKRAAGDIQAGGGREVERAAGGDRARGRHEPR